jgi:hypothetical protein
LEIGENLGDGIVDDDGCVVGVVMGSSRERAGRGREYGAWHKLLA